GAHEQRYYVLYMRLGGAFVRRIRIAYQEAKVLDALDQRAEMLGRAQRLGYSQQATGTGLSEKLLQVEQQLLRAGVEERAHQRRVLRRHGHHHPVQADRLGAVDERMEGSGDVQQYLFDRGLIVQLKQPAWQTGLARGSHRGATERLLVAEMAVQRELGDAGLGGDSVHAAALVAVAEEQYLRRGQYRLAFGWVFGAAWAGCGKAGIHGHFNTGLVGRLFLLYPAV